MHRINLSSFLVLNQEKGTKKVLKMQEMHKKYAFYSNFVFILGEKCDRVYSTLEQVSQELYRFIYCCFEQRKSFVFN